MTTEFKRALDALEKDPAPSFVIHHKETILRALMVADAIHNGSLDKKPNDADPHPIFVAKAIQNQIVEHLKSIGGGE